MIRSKMDLRKYLEMDAKAIGVDPKKRYFIGKEIWRFERSLRHYEYYLNCSRNVILKKYWYVIYRRWSIKLGFVIPPNIFGECELIIMEIS